MTAYQGAAVSGILSGSTLAAALGIWATEAYHAGAIRALLIQNIGAPELAVSSNGMNTTITLDQIVSRLCMLSCRLGWLCSAAASLSVMSCIPAICNQGVTSKVPWLNATRAIPLVWLGRAAVGHMVTHV